MVPSGWGGQLWGATAESRTDGDKLITLMTPSLNVLSQRSQAVEGVSAQGLVRTAEGGCPRPARSLRGGGLPIARLEEAARRSRGAGNTVYVTRERWAGWEGEAVGHALAVAVGL